MEVHHKTVDNRELLETYRELLPKVESLPLLVSGNSMSPFLIHGRDTVHLTKIDRPLKKGDIVLYLRDNGQYILHRICRVNGDTFSIIGDAQTVIETGVRRDQIFARVAWAERKGKKQAPGSLWWEFFEKIWIRMIPVRPAVQKCWSAIKKITGG